MKQSTLDHLLVTLDVGVEAFAICEVRRGCRLVGGPANAIKVHYVLAGTMHLMIPGADPIVCQSGGVVVVPPGIAQTIAADPGPTVEIAASEHCSMARDGLLVFDAADGAPGDLRVACGVIMANLSGSFGLLDQLAGPLVEDLGGIDIVPHAFAIVLDEMARPRLGTRALAGSLMKACLVIVLRRFFEASASRSGLLGDPRDPRLSKALTAVLDKPAAPHTVASLAAVAGMSRSVFARDFMNAFSIGPMEFVARTRLRHAAEMLRSTTVSIKVIASSIGFASRSHFSRAFRDAYGTDPRSFRKAVSVPQLDVPKP